MFGWSEPKGARSAFGALLLGLHDKDSGELRYAGKVGTGFNETTLRTIYAQLLRLETPSPAVVNPPKGYEAKGAHWLRPELLAEVAYAAITADGSVRHSVFQGLRNDKSANAITEEVPAPVEVVDKPDAHKISTPATSATKFIASKGAVQTTGKVRITHPDRIIDATSGSTKMQLAEYYLSIADWILPHLENRPIALGRAPAESCAGQIVALLASVPGAGQLLESGYVVYSPKAKQRILHVNPLTIASKGLTSEEVAAEMALGALKGGPANVAIVTTGVAGPEAIDGIAPGTVCLAWVFLIAGKTFHSTRTEHFEGCGLDVEMAASAHALGRIQHFHGKALAGEHG